MSQTLVDQPAGLLGCSQLQDFISLGWWEHPTEGDRRGGPSQRQRSVVPWS